MVNTFMATPYDTENLPRRFVTPANSRTDLTTEPDPYMQTTPLDAGRILEMVYQLSKGGGTLTRGLSRRNLPPRKARPWST